MIYRESRPIGITALSIFFAFGATISFITFIALLWPGGFLEPIWRLRPIAHDNFTRMGIDAIILMIVVCVSCAFATIGLWRGRRWGYWVAIALLAINMIGDIVNVILGTELKAAVGIPIVAAILLFMRSKRVRLYFGK